MVKWTLVVVLVMSPPQADAVSETDPGPGDSAIGTDTPAEPDEEVDPVIEAAKDDYERGMAEYEAGRYERAVDRWVAAYSTLDPSYAHARIRAAIIYNIASAQRKQFEIDGAIEHLRQARTSLRSYADDIDEVYPDGAERDAERGSADRLIAELDEAIAAAEDAERERELETARAGAPKFDPVLDAQQRRSNRGLIIGGAVLSGVGVAAGGTLLAGLGVGAAANKSVPGLVTASDLEARRDAMRRGQLGNALAVVGAITTPLLLGTGVGLLGAGLSRERKRRAYSERAQSARVRWTLTPGPAPAGLGAWLDF